MMAIFAMVATLGFTACSSDDDDNNNGGGNTPTPGAADYSSVKTTPMVAIALGMLDIFDVTITANGKTETVTADKVKNMDIKPTGASESTTPVAVLAYSMETTTSKCPASIPVEVEAKFKEGVDLTKLAKSDYCLTPMLSYQYGTNAAQMFIPILVKSTGVQWSKLAEDENKMNTFSKNLKQGFTISLGTNGSVSIK